MNYPISKTNCSSCHNVHGSDRARILYDNVHMPVANRLCNQCHEASNSSDPLKTKRTGFELCRGCHSSMMNDTFNKNRVHWPLVDKVGCLNCHEPHASPQKKLLMGDMKSLCEKCHSDTMEAQGKAMVFSASKDSNSFSPLTKSLREYLNFPTSIIADNKGIIYVVDQNGGGIVILGQDGSYLGRQLSMGWNEGLLYYPSQMCINEKGEVFIADRGNSRVQIFTLVK